MSVTSGGERDQLKNAKIAVLKLITEHKEILFGKLSDTLTKEVKESKWAEVADYAHALGAFPWHRNWDYLKDTTWQNWRKRFVEKREKKEKFENTGIGSKIIYDEADLLIMGILDSSCKNGPNSAQSSFSKMYSTPDNIRDISDILEIEFDVKTEDSDTVDGSDPYNSNGNHGGIISHEDLNMEYSTSANLGIPTDELHNDCHDDVHTAYESQPTHSNYDPNGHENSDATNNDTLQQPKIVSTSSLSAISRAASIRKSAYSALRTGMGSRKRPASYMLNNSGIGNGISRDRELTDLKCRKIRAELDLLQRETYKKDLEILQLERSLGLPASNITKKFYRFNNRTNSSIIANNK